MHYYWFWSRFPRLEPAAITLSDRARSALDRLPGPFAGGIISGIAYSVIHEQDIAYAPQTQIKADADGGRLPGVGWIRFQEDPCRSRELRDGLSILLRSPARSRTEIREDL